MLNEWPSPLLDGELLFILSSRVQRGHILAADGELFGRGLNGGRDASGEAVSLSRQGVVVVWTGLWQRRYRIGR